jgi:SAM-dependent methyltransferase
MFDQMFGQLRGSLARLAAWAGTDRLSALRERRTLLADCAITPASAPLALLVAGTPVRADWVPDRDELVARGLVTIAGDLAHPTACVLPLRRSLIVCDLPDDTSHEAVYWPDDSSEHLARSLPPGRRTCWLDLCCGSGYAPLARPELASEIVGVDLNVRAVRYAGLGAELSNIHHLTAEPGDLAVPAAVRGRCELVTCNAPIPDLAAPLWYATDDATFFPRMFASAREALRPGGLFVAHAALDAVVPIAIELPGERVIVAYTPPEIRPFCITWWRPDAPTRFASIRRELTTDRPYIDYDDYVLASTAAWGSSPRSS